jgi:hypothetical protein
VTMAKQAITKEETGGNLATAQVGGALIQGSEASDFSLPNLHLFQDVGNESDQYGDHDKGTWVNSLTGEEIDTEKGIVPITAQKNTVVWHHRDSGQTGMVAMFDNRKDVPDNFVAGQGTEVDIVDYVNLIVLAIDDPELPFVIRHKSSGLTAVRMLNTLEAGRGRANKGPGLYKLTSKEKTNAKGKWYIPMYVPKGDPDKDLIDLALTFHEMFAHKTIAVDETDVPF